MRCLWWNIWWNVTETQQHGIWCLVLKWQKENECTIFKSNFTAIPVIEIGNFQICCCLIFIKAKSNAILKIAGVKFVVEKCVRNYSKICLSIRTSIICTIITNTKYIHQGATVPPHSWTVSPTTTHILHQEQRAQSMSIEKQKIEGRNEFYLWKKINSLECKNKSLAKDIIDKNEQIDKLQHEFVSQIQALEMPEKEENLWIHNLRVCCYSIIKHN